jgi:hypothetical protein
MLLRSALTWRLGGKRFEIQTCLVHDSACLGQRWLQDQAPRALCHPDARHGQTWCEVEAAVAPGVLKAVSV